MANIIETNISVNHPRRIFTAFEKNPEGYHDVVGRIFVHANTTTAHVNDCHTHGEVFSLQLLSDDPHIGYDLLDAATDALGVPLTRADDSTYSAEEMRYLRHLPVAAPTA